MIAERAMYQMAIDAVCVGAFRHAEYWLDYAEMDRMVHNWSLLTGAIGNGDGAKMPAELARHKLDNAPYIIE